MLLLVACAEERDRGDANVTGRVHPPGILDEESDHFHGKELARRDYDFSLCAKCHGDDFSGGAANASCLDCHTDGPTACSTCHREDTERGAHAVHRTTMVECAECHTVPTSWDSEGHIRRDGMADPRPAEVVFGARAALTGTPVFADGTCSNVYCHGATSPRWDAPVTGSCDTCHGAPPPSHFQDQCATCHPTGAPHVDGTVQIGRTNGCDGCHGRGGNAAPPYDLAGNEFSTALGVGAHHAHLNAPSQLRAPLQCSECHAVPTSLLAAGHIDSALPAEVLPGVAWNRLTQTCGTWCHGSAAPVWTQTGGATCGTCHGVPPATAAHAGVTGVQMCAGCHPALPGAAHMDGDVDVF